MGRPIQCTTRGQVAASADGDMGPAPLDGHAGFLRAHVTECFPNWRPTPVFVELEVVGVKPMEDNVETRMLERINLKKSPDSTLQPRSCPAFSKKYRLGRHAKVDTRYNCPLYLPKYLPMKNTTYK